MALAAQEAIKDENPIDMFVSVIKASQNWVATSDIEIMKLKARLERFRELLCPKVYGPLNIMQSNLQPYPAKFICEIYLSDEESESFSSQIQPDLNVDASDDYILGVFQDIPISFMLQDRHDESKVRFIKLWQSDGNFKCALDYLRWEDFKMDCDDDDYYYKGDHARDSPSDDEAAADPPPVAAADDRRNRIPNDNAVDSDDDDW